MTTRTPCDDVRGVAGHRSRVNPANDADFDRLAMSHGVPVPWNHEPEFDEPPDPFYRIITFLHRLANLGTTDREIFFARLLNMSWADIASAFLRGKNGKQATPQAAEKRFSDMVAKFPELGRAFPESKRVTKTTKG